MVTGMVRHYDQDEREIGGLYHWDTVRTVLLQKRVEHCVDHKNSLCYLRAIQGHSGGIPIMSELMGYTSIPCIRKEYIFHRGCSWSVQSILGRGLIPGGKESDNARQTVFFTPLNPFGENPDEEEPSRLRSSSESALSQSLKS